MKKTIIISINIIGVVVIVAAIIYLVVRPEKDEGFQGPIFQEPTIEELIEEGRAHEESEKVLKQLEEANPLVQKLPYKGDGFEVHYGTESEDTLEVFYTIILNPQTSKSLRDEYAAEIEELMARSQTWIASQGIDTDNLLIQWTTR